MGHEMFIPTLIVGYKWASIIVIVETPTLWDIFENIYYHKNNENRKGIYYIPGKNDDLSKFTSVDLWQADILDGVDDYICKVIILW